MLLNKENKKSIRSAFGKTLAELGKTNKDIVVMDADLACSTQSQMFGKEFPDRFFDCGIAEQDMIATAAGLASEGKIPFVSSFAMFATGRTYDQIRNSVCYPEFNVKIIGTHGGITVGEDGASHQALEDIALMRNIPNMSVIVPADCKECEEVIKFAANNYGPMYIRIARTNLCDIFDDSYEFDFCKVKVIEEGTDVTVITNGETLAEVIEAGEILKAQGYSVQILHAPVVKPLDIATIIEKAKQTKFVITVENHSIIGGLGSAVCELLAEYYPMPVHRFGINDTFGQSGKWDFLLDYYGLSAQKLAKNIKKQIDIYRLVK
ncbi:transketolase family protein [Spirochaetes bacterium]|uniref:Transketolase family protein n=1 Tax=Candidatus Scatousia excrementipullorum TaxID=2840936 RepID=A0A9D9H046_9BACT|nr:transketolase family protein [Candidatus Scatousia excrementipullorum]